MRSRFLVPALLAAAALGGCEVPTAAQRARLDAFIGHPEIDLLRAYGVPSRSYAAQGHTFLAYQTGYTTIDPGFGPWDGFGPFGYGGFGGFGYGGFGYGGLGYGGFGGIPPTVNNYTCNTTFEIVDDRVAAWTLRGDGC